ncbi:hypothetical protein AVEN_198958-1, partial [Araneus ventricosus]
LHSTKFVQGVKNLPKTKQKILMHTHKTKSKIRCPKSQNYVKKDKTKTKLIPPLLDPANLIEPEKSNTKSLPTVSSDKDNSDPVEKIMNEISESCTNRPKKELSTLALIGELEVRIREAHIPEDTACLFRNIIGKAVQEINILRFFGTPSPPTLEKVQDTNVKKQDFSKKKETLLENPPMLHQLIQRSNRKNSNFIEVTQIASPSNKENTHEAQTYANTLARNLDNEDNIPFQKVRNKRWKKIEEPVLPPKKLLPTIIVKPLGNNKIRSSIELKLLLEKHIKPRLLGVKVVTLRKSLNNGVIIQVETEDMANNLLKAINDHQEVKFFCLAKRPVVRNPQILIYDIEKCDGDREVNEKLFISKIRESNDLPEGDIKVLFRKKGKGSLEHWVLSVDPAIFKSIKDLKWLCCGFGSYKFKEHLEPLRCFHCHRFGHQKKNCDIEKPQCQRCTKTHGQDQCDRKYPVCRNCKDFSNKTGKRLLADHSATSDKCPVYLREKAQLKIQTNYV